MAAPFRQLYDKLSLDESRVMLQGIPWQQYQSLREATEGQGVRLTYLDGALEIMSPSEVHEESISLLRSLLLIWALEHDVDLCAFASTTWRSEATSVGAEADESYRLGQKPPGTMPDLAIEVVVTSPSRDKLAVYARLGVREVWQWWPLSSRLTVQTLVGDQYEERAASVLLPDLDLPTLVSFASRRGERHIAVIREYRARLISAG